MARIFDRVKSLLARPRDGSVAPGHNLLVASDLHIGQDLKARARLDTLQRVVSFDHEFCSFLRYYAQHRVHGRPWRLVIDGDMVDFMHIHVLPDAWEQRKRWRSRITDEERRFGLDSDVDKVLFKLECAVERHRAVFEALTSFVALGNDLHVIAGNHDIEWHWAEVQQAFKLRLAELLTGLEEEWPGGAPPERDRFLASVHFHAWFYYEPGVIYLEHGHQYDEYSSFEYLLNPVSPVDRRRAEMTGGHLVIRYFINALSGVDHHGKEGWSLTDYAGWLLARWPQIPKLFVGYVRMIYMLVVYNRREREAPHETIATEHRARLTELATSAGVPPDTLRAIDALRRPPVTKSLAGTLQLIMADRVIAGAAALGCVLMALAPGLSWPGRAVLLGLAAAAPIVTEALRRVRPVHEVTAGIAEAARAIAALLRVRYVVFGHTHEPQVVPVGSNAQAAFYVNTGSWVPVPHEPGAPRSHGAGQVPFTHLVVERTEASPWAELRRWSSHDGAPLTFRDVDGVAQHGLAAVATASGREG